MDKVRRKRLKAVIAELSLLCDAESAALDSIAEGFGGSALEDVLAANVEILQQVLNDLDGVEGGGE